MNDRMCLGCGEPLTGMRSDAKQHTACRRLRLVREQQGDSERLWRSLGLIRWRGTRTWIRPRRASPSVTSGDVVDA